MLSIMPTQQFQHRTFTQSPTTRTTTSKSIWILNGLRPNLLLLCGLVLLFTLLFLNLTILIDVMQSAPHAKAPQLTTS